MKKFLALLLVSLMACGLTACGGGEERAEAEATFLAATEAANLANTALDDAVSAAQEVLNLEKVALDESTRTDLQVVISALRESRVTLPEKPSKAEDMVAEAEELMASIDYSEGLANLSEAKKALEDSMKQMEQITNPTGDFVILRISEVESIGDVRGVTEDNDPNGKLNKQGGYTSATYFASTLIDQTSVYGSDTIEKGTAAGGCIEVYQTPEGASTRNDYLAAFDSAGAFSSGSHVVYGTVVIRTSDELTATQQSELTEQIKGKLVELRDE